MPPSGSFFPIGTTTVTCTSTDAVHTPTATATFQVRIADIEPPVLRLPGDMSVLADCGQRERSICIPGRHGHDNSGATVTPHTHRRPGSCSRWAGPPWPAPPPTRQRRDRGRSVDLVERLGIAAHPRRGCTRLSICGANPQRFARQRSVRVCIGSSAEGNVNASARLTIGERPEARLALAEVSRRST